MDEKTLQAAAQTFCLVPEIYAQAFKQAGADFPEELVAQIKKQPKQAMQMLQEDKELLQGVVTIYSQYHDQIDQAAAQAAQQAGLFKKGGKLEQLLVKFAKKGTKTEEPELKPRKDGVEGYSSERVLPDGSREYQLTRWHDSIAEPGYYDDTRLRITPQNDTIVNIGQIGVRDEGMSNLLGRDYHTKTAIEKRRAEHPIWSRIFPWRPIPNNVLPAFRDNGLIE